ncbi:hypothetical protein JTB14_028022 [Gonioctena quinquepunctata]|nr:hypothetical protein JTB14_028022 [Gonioctena quinquepunctata]
MNSPTKTLILRSFSQEVHLLSHPSPCSLPYSQITAELKVGSTRVPETFGRISALKNRRLHVEITGEQLRGLGRDARFPSLAVLFAVFPITAELKVGSTRYLKPSEDFSAEKSKTPRGDHGRATTG